MASETVLTFCFRRDRFLMEPDIHALSKAGISKEQIEEIIGCDDKEIQVRMLRKYRYKLLDEIHRKQQSLDEIDYMVSKLKAQS